MKAILAFFLLALAAATVCVKADSGDAITATGTLSGATYNVTVSTPLQQIQQILDNLKPGDVLNFLPGLYANLALNVKVSGTASAWITIRGILCGTDKPILQIDTDILQLPAITISAGANFVLIQDLEINQIGDQVASAIEFVNTLTGSISNIILQDLIIDNINGIGIDLSDVNNIVNVLVTKTVISNVGLLSNVVGNLGSGFIAGGILEPVLNVVNIQFVNNVVHDVFGQVGSAVQILKGVLGARVLDNVIWNVANGLTGELNAAIQVVTGITSTVAAGVTADLAVVARNLITDMFSIKGALASVFAIQIGAGTQCVNNIIVGAENGISVVLGGALNFANTLIAHNTVVNVVGTVLSIVDKALASTLTIVNNILAVGTNTVGSVLNIATKVLSSPTALIKNNIVQGLLGITGNVHPGKRAVSHNQQIQLNNLAGFIPAALDSIFSSVSDILDELQLLPLEGILDNVLDTVGGVVDQVGVTVTTLLSDVEKTVDTLIADVNNVIDALGNPLGLGTPLKSILNSVGSVADNVLENLGETVDQTVDTVDDLIAALQDDVHVIVPAVDGVLGSVSQILGTVSSSTGGLLGLGGLLGRRQLNLGGVVGTVTSLTDVLTNTVQGTVGNVAGVVLSANDAVLANALLTASSALNSVLGNVNGDLADSLNVVNTAVNGLLNGLLTGQISGATDDVKNIVALVLNDVRTLLGQTVDTVDSLLANALQLVDFDGNLRLGRFTIGALQVGGVHWDLREGFKGVDVDVVVPCVQVSVGGCSATKRMPIRS